MPVLRRLVPGNSAVESCHSYGQQHCALPRPMIRREQVYGAMSSRYSIQARMIEHREVTFGRVSNSHGTSGPPCESAGSASSFARYGRMACPDQPRRTVSPGEARAAVLPVRNRNLRVNAACHLPMNVENPPQVRVDGNSCRRKLLRLPHDESTPGVASVRSVACCASTGVIDASPLSRNLRLPTGTSCLANSSATL